jgi:AcrR family transcriptional regulator
MSLRERKKLETRQLLADTATELFLAKGFDAVRVTEIAEACGVSEKTVYNYFPTKEALLLDQHQYLPAALRSAFSDPETPPLAAAIALLANELDTLIARMSAEPDFTEARMRTRRFGDLLRSTASLRAYQHDVTERLTVMIAEILAARAGAASSADPEALAAAHAVLGLWSVQYASLRRHLQTAPTAEALAAAVTTDVHQAAKVIEHGLATWPSR